MLVGLSCFNGMTIFMFNNSILLKSMSARRLVEECHETP
jgi:hypothetical protein